MAAVRAVGALGAVGAVAWRRRGFGHTLEAFSNTCKGGQGGGEVGGGGGGGVGLGTHRKPLWPGWWGRWARTVGAVGGGEGLGTHIGRL